MAKNNSINLLPQEEFEASVLGRALRWAMGTFRIIVIATEMIVMGAFLSRFWLDAQNSDLNDLIQIKSAQISSQSDFENQFRKTQQKLAIFKGIAANPPASAKLDLVASKLPSDVILSSISVGDSSTDIKGSAGSEQSIAQFISNLKAEKSFKSVELNSLNSAKDNAASTVFTLAINY